MNDSPARGHLRRRVVAHMTQLGYSSGCPGREGTPAAEIMRMNPVRGRIAYGETVLHSDLRRRSCHERLRYFSQRRTRRRSTILFFIGVAEADRPELETLLARLDIRSATRGGHVHVVPIASPAETRQLPASHPECG